VVIIGAGAIGPDIGYYLKTALPDLTLHLVDVAQAPLDRAVERFKSYAQKGVERGKLNPAQAEQVMQNLHVTLDYAVARDADWVIEAAIEAIALKRQIFARIEEIVPPEAMITSNTSSLPAERIFAGETTLPTLDPGAGKTKTAWLWAYARDDTPFGGTSPPMVAYRFEDSRSGDCVARHLAGFAGILQVDGYAAYTQLAKAKIGSNEGMALAGCWAHLRRRFYELHINGSSQIATQTITTMAGLWKIEEEIRGCDAAVRLTARRDRSAAIVADLFKLWETELPRISGKSKLAEAIRYATSRREILGRFLLDGRIEIDSNIVERAIRPQTITRKNALFAGSDGGGRTWATIATLLQTAKMNDVDPLAWLAQTLERIANRWPISQIDELMPWNYKA
jgi:hypothetical protein